MSWQVLALRRLKLLIGPETGKTQNQKSLQKLYDEAKQQKEKSKSRHRPKPCGSRAGVKGEIANLTVLLAEKL